MHKNIKISEKKKKRKKKSDRREREGIESSLVSLQGIELSGWLVVKWKVKWLHFQAAEEEGRKEGRTEIQSAAAADWLRS